MKRRKEGEPPNLLNQQNVSQSYYQSYPNTLPQDEGGGPSGLPWGGINMGVMMAQGHATPRYEGSGPAPTESASNWDSGTSYVSPYGDGDTHGTTTTATTTNTTTTTTTPGTSTGITTPASTTTGTGYLSYGGAGSDYAPHWDYDDDNNNDDYYDNQWSYYEYEEGEEKDGGSGGNRSGSCL